MTVAEETITFWHHWLRAHVFTDEVIMVIGADESPQNIRNALITALLRVVKINPGSSAAELYRLLGARCLDHSIRKICFPLPHE